MNRAERIYRIDALLKEKPRSLEQLQAALEASRATVVRDLGYMRELMQAPIEYDRASNGYRYAADGPRFELPGFWLNESEPFALLASGQMLDQMQPGLLAPYIGPLRGASVPCWHRADTVPRLLPTASCSSPWPRAPPTRSASAPSPAHCLPGCPLAIAYHGRERNVATERVVHPQRLIRYRDNWSLAAHCERASGLRIFSLDRIERAEPQPRPALRAGAALYTEDSLLP